MLKAVSSEMLTVFADNANRAYFTLRGRYKLHGWFLSVCIYTNVKQMPFQDLAILSVLSSEKKIIIKKDPQLLLGLICFSQFRSKGSIFSLLKLCHHRQ